MTMKLWNLYLSVMKKVIKQGHKCKYVFVFKIMNPYERVIAVYPTRIIVNTPADACNPLNQSEVKDVCNRRKAQENKVKHV